MSHSSPLPNGIILENRYRIIKKLGEGGFGRTYLAEDINRFGERCVLKEFAPKVNNSQELKKAQELFQREAGVLYTLNHDQIPRFRELIQINSAGNDSIFLVQDYVEGPSYLTILTQGKRFSEAEVKQLLLNTLTVLEYLHNQNVIHRDISPDNLIQRQADEKPILIDFGAVKKMAATVTGIPLTVIGKKHYAPEEQMLRGQAFPASDLYALAVTVLALLTGEHCPKDLYDSHLAKWNWRGAVSVSDSFARVLDKMLAYKLCDRYQSAREVREALNDPSLNSSNPVISQTPTQENTPPNPILSQMATQVVAPANPNPSPPQPNRSLDFTPIKKAFKFIATAIFIAGITGVGAFSAVKWYLDNPIKMPEVSALNTTEEQRQKTIYQRVQTLGINEGQFYAEVDEIFYQRYPQLKNTRLTDKPEHQAYRKAWYEIAENLLNDVEQQKQ